MTVRGGNAFEFPLLQKLCRSERKSFVISPKCLGLCLAMVSAGLRGESKTELMEFLYGRQISESEEETLHDVSKANLASHLPWKMAFRALVKDTFEVRKEAAELLEVSTHIAAHSPSSIIRAVNWSRKVDRGKSRQFFPYGKFSRKTANIRGI